MALFRVLIEKLQFFCVSLIFVSTLFWPRAAIAAEKRVALVIGNGAYTRVPKLPNPLNDAAAIENLLKAVGFDKVVRASDLGGAQMRRLLRTFSDDARDADIALVFFAGHGMEMNGVNYLIPVDAVLERDIDLEDEAISLYRVNQVLEGARRLRLIILDACRDNPFLRSIRRTLVGRSIGRGLAPIEVVSSETLIAYAAKAGSTASDGDTANSPYTTALTRHLATPGLDVRLAFGRVRDEVLRTTGNRQEPFVYGSLGGAELALVPTSNTSTPTTLASAKALESTEHDAAAAWASIKETGSSAILEAFIARYGATFHGELARHRLADLRRIEREQHAIVLPKSQSVEGRPESDRKPLAPAVQGPDPGCFDASSASPDVVIRACSALLSGRPARTRLERALNRRGLAYYRTERYQEALADFNQLIVSNRTHSGYFDNRMSVYKALKQYDLALRDAAETVRLSPNGAFAYHSRANLYFDMGRYGDAIAEFNRALAETDVSVWSLYDRGRAYAKLGRFDDAIRDLTSVLQKDASTVWAYRERGFAHIGAGAMDKARADLQIFLAHEPSDPEASQALQKLSQGRQ